MAQAGGAAQRLGIVGQDLVRGGRAAPEALEQPRVDRRGGPGGELLADDRAHQRPVVVGGAAGEEVSDRADLVDDAAQDRVGLAERRDGRRLGGGGHPRSYALSVTVSAAPSRAPRARCTEHEMHVKVGVSRRVYELDSVVRRRWTRSRKSAGLSVSKATRNSWSSSPNEYEVFRSTDGYSRPTRMCSCMIRQRSSRGSEYQARVLTKG